MEAIKQHKGLIAIAILLLGLVGVSALNSDDTRTDASTEKAETSQEASAETNEDATTSDDAAEADESETESDSAEASNSDDEESAPADESESDTDNAGTYSYTAQPGDSYSVLARKAVQTYGIINDVSLTRAEIIAAETFLTQESNQGLLNEGQSVTFDTAQVKSAMDRAQDLSDGEKAIWATYIPYVEFDTRNFGE